MPSSPFAGPAAVVNSICSRFTRTGWRSETGGWWRCDRDGVTFRWKDYRATRTDPSRRR